MTKTLYTLEEAAAELGLSVYGARRAADRGRLVTEKLGNLRVVTKPEIERYRRDNLGNVGQPPKPKRAKKG